MTGVQTCALPIWLRDVARVELGSRSYDLFSRVNGRTTTLILVYLQTGANALSTLEAVRASMDEATYCGLIPVARSRGGHLRNSSAKNAANSAGVVILAS